MLIYFALMRCPAATSTSLLGFGSNIYGELGDSNTDDRWIPTVISGNVVTAAAGCFCTFFITADGSLWATGKNNGRLGDGTTFLHRSPVKVASDVVAVSTATNGGHAVFVKNDGTLWGMGYNSAGELGIPDHSQQPDPYLHATPELIATNVASAVAAGEFTLFVKTDGSLWATGDNSRGQLGDGTLNSHRTPIQVGADVVAIAANEVYSMFIKRDGTLWGMGDNWGPQFGGPRGTYLFPVLIASDVTAVAAGFDFSLFVKRDHTLWGLGNCLEGVFDNGTFKYSSDAKVYECDPLSKPSLIATDVMAVAAGPNQSFYIKNDGSLWAAGYNVDGQIGDGATFGWWRYGAVQIAENVKSVFAGDYHALYLGGRPTPSTPLVWFIGGRLLNPGAPQDFKLLLKDPNGTGTVWKLTAQSSDQWVLPDSAITFGGTVDNRTVHITPIAGHFGITSVTITADNGLRTESMTARVQIPPTDAQTMFTDPPQIGEPRVGDDFFLQPHWIGSFPPSPLQWEVSENGGPWTALTDDAHYSRTHQELLDVYSVTLAMDGNAYRLRAGTGTGQIVTQPYQINVCGTGPLTNISSRAFVGTGEAVAIAGFVIRGTVTKRILVRGSGPALGTFGITDALTSPVLQLLRDSQVLSSNTGWSSAANADDIQSIGAQVGAFPWTRGSTDSGLIATVSPAPYTAIVSGEGGSSGVALLEVYDADAAGATSSIVNISTRAQVTAGDGVLIAGLTITGTVPKRVFVRASAQALTRFGVANVLSDPVLELYHGDSLFYSSAWGIGSPPQDVTTAVSHVGAFASPVGSTDPAVVLYLAPGAYTMAVRSKAGHQGIALIEAYDDD